jgi:hypothetical protein
MNRSVRLGVAGFLFTMFAGIAGAQMGMHRAPAMHGIFSPVVGSGAEYDLTTQKGEKMDMTFAIVGKETVDGKDAYWLEMTMNGAQVKNMATKSLTVLDGQQTYVSRMIMQMPNMPPMEMPAQMLQRNGKESPDVRDRGEDVGSESITTPAGTFLTEHYKMKDGTGDAWVAPKAGPYGLVKFQGKDASMVLTKVFSDAQDKITGTPQPFNPMMMGQRDQQHP